MSSSPNLFGPRLQFPPNHNGKNEKKLVGDSRFDYNYSNGKNDFTKYFMLKKRELKEDMIRMKLTMLRS